MRGICSWPNERRARAPCGLAYDPTIGWVLSQGASRSVHEIQCSENVDFLYYLDSCLSLSLSVLLQAGLSRLTYGRSERHRLLRQQHRQKRRPRVLDEEVARDLVRGGETCAWSSRHFRSYIEAQGPAFALCPDPFVCCPIGQLELSQRVSRGLALTMNNVLTWELTPLLSASQAAPKPASSSGDSAAAAAVVSG